MSILVSGMKMPKNCSECKLVTQYYDGGSDVCCLLDKYTDCEDRLDDCPIAEVSTPHGRLIDANALDDAFTNLRWTTGDYKAGELAHWGDRKDWCLKGQEVDELIQSAPTIIEGESGEGWVF